MFEKKELSIIQIQALGVGLMAFNKAAEEHGVNARLGYKMARFADKVAKVSETIDKQRQAIFTKHGKEKDGQIEIPKKNMEKFNNDIQDFFNQKDTIEVLSEKIKLDEFGDIKLPPSFMNTFKDYIEE